MFGRPCVPGFVVVVELFNRARFFFALGNCDFTSYFAHRIEENGKRKRFHVISPANRKSRRRRLWKILRKILLNIEKARRGGGGAAKLLWENNCILGKKLLASPQKTGNICCLLFTTK